MLQLFENEYLSPMLVLTFDKSQHVSHVCSWLEARGLSVPSEDDFPKIGFIIQHEGQFICCNFLRMVEGGYAQLDGMTSNPAIPAKLRDIANDLITCALLKAAKELKVKRIIAYSQDKNTLLRSYRHGFVEQPHTLIAIDPGADEHSNLQE